MFGARGVHFDKWCISVVCGVGMQIFILLLALSCFDDKVSNFGFKKKKKKKKDEEEKEHNVR